MAQVDTTREGAVLTITLNRPDVLNALNRSVHEGIRAGLERAQDPSVRAVIITGAGRGFCVGQDLQEFSSGAGDVAQNLRDNYHRNVLATKRQQLVDGETVFAFRRKNHGKKNHLHAPVGGLYIEVAGYKGWVLGDSYNEIVGQWAAPPDTDGN